MIFQHIDGVLLTGGYSNIQPYHYNQQPSAGEDHIDPERDTTNLSLIPQILEAGIPMLASVVAYRNLMWLLGVVCISECMRLKGLCRPS